MTKKRIITIVVICLVIFSVLSFIMWSNFWPQSQPIPLMPLAREEEGAEVTTAPSDKPRLKGVQIALVDEDQHLNWKLHVEQVIEEGEVCLLFGITGEYYTVSGQKYTVEAPEGKTGNDFSWLWLSPEVVFSGEEIRLLAEEVSWKAESGEEITGRQLQADGDNVKIEAEKFTFNPEEGGMTFPGESRWSFR